MSGDQVLHMGRVTEGTMTLGDAVTLSLDTEHRLGCMRHHTATHVLNSVLNTILPVSPSPRREADSSRPSTSGLTSKCSKKTWTTR